MMLYMPQKNLSMEILFQKTSDLTSSKSSLFKSLAIMTSACVRAKKQQRTSKTSCLLLKHAL